MEPKTKPKRRLAIILLSLSFLLGSTSAAAAHSLYGGTVYGGAIDSSGNGYSTKGFPRIAHTRYVYAYSGSRSGGALFASAVGVKVRCYRDGSYVGTTSTYYNFSGGLGRGAGSSSICGSSSGGFQAKSYLYSYGGTGYALKTSWSPGHNF